MKTTPEIQRQRLHLAVLVAQHLAQPARKPPKPWTDQPGRSKRKAGGGK